MAEKKQLITDPKENVIYYPNGKFMFTTGAAAAAAGSILPTANPSAPALMTDLGGFEFAPWGVNNQYPQTIIDKIKADPIIPALLNRHIRTIYGQGMVYGDQDYTDSGEEIFTPKKYPEIEQFKKQSNTDKYLRESILDFFYLFNIYPEIILTKDRSQVFNITRQKAVECRWSKKKAGQITPEYCFIYGDWRQSTEIEKAIKVPVINTDFFAVENTRAGKDFKYIYPVSYPDPENHYYTIAPWHSFLSCKWYDLLQNIPVFKNAMFDNQLSIMYHIEIAVEYWPWKFKGDWEKFSDAEKKEKIKAEFDGISAMLHGAPQAGKSYYSAFFYDEQQRANPYIKITAIDNKLKSGIYVEDSNEAMGYLFTALEMDPTLMGSVPGKNFGSGSGSDKRVAQNNYVSLATMYVDIILEPIRFIANYNGWTEKYPNLVFKMQNTLINTLDTGKETSATTV
jgi:hypothetical protein